LYVFSEIQEISRKMKINLKSGSSSQKQIDISETATVKDFRADVASSFSTEPTQIVLIFAGKILKDETTLTENKIVDGVSVHVVVKKGSTPAPAPATSTPASNPTPTQPSAETTSARDTPASTGNPFGGMGGLLNSGNLQQASQELMRNPEMMQNMLNNPMVQSMMSDPAVIQEMMNSNPQTRQLMDSNPEIRELMNNPSVLRDAMRMASNPAAMQEMIRHQDRAMQNIEGIPGGFNHLRRLHEEVAEPLQNAFSGGNNFQSENNSNNTASTEAQQEENTSALPNPWGGNSNANSNESNAGNSGNSRVPGMSQGLMDAMMRHMASNPEMAAQMSGLNPSNLSPQMREQFSRMFSNPGALQAMQRPEVAQAMRQIQEGIATIRRVAPELADSMGLPTNIPGAAGLGGASAAPTTPQQPPEERFASQLQQLEAMGFVDKEKISERCYQPVGRLTPL
jgi:ubiquilin